MSQVKAIDVESRQLSLPFYYGWVNVFLASVAMTATLPGRTHGLGQITEPLLKDLHLERTTFSDVNMAATLIGAAFSLSIGPAIDRLGVRLCLTLITAALGVTVVGFSHIGPGIVPFTIFLILIRGLGQSALSVVSMALIGKWFRRRLGLAMGVYTALMTVGFIGSILGMALAVEAVGWREAWEVLGYLLLGLSPLGWVLARDTPEAMGVVPDAPAASLAVSGFRDFTFGEALLTPAFWVLAFGTSAFNVVYSAITLHNESVLAERGFSNDIAKVILALLVGFGLPANVVAGYFATRSRISWLLGIGLALLAVNMALFPNIHSPAGIWFYASSMGITGGIIMVVFFAAWGHVYGRTNLGKIQGSAQVISTLSSASGPALMAHVQHATGSYVPMFYAMAAGAGALSLAAFVVKIPERQSLSGAIPAQNEVPTTCPMCGHSPIDGASKCPACGEAFLAAAAPRLADPHTCVTPATEKA